VFQLSGAPLQEQQLPMPLTTGPQMPRPVPPHQESHSELVQQPGEAKQNGLRQGAASAVSGRLTNAAAVRATASRNSPILFFIVAPFCSDPLERAATH
jgi:hypothetical protein